MRRRRRYFGTRNLLLVVLINVEGPPTEADSGFKEANINHLVYAIVSPIFDTFI